MNSSIAELRHAVTVLACAAAMGGLPACGGGGAGSGLASEPALAASAGPDLEGQRVSGRDVALQIVASGVIAPLRFSELAHALLARAFEQRGGASPASPGERWVLVLDAQPVGAGAAVFSGLVAIEIEAADHAEGLMQGGEAGSLRARLRLEHVALGAAARIDGAIVLEVARTTAGVGAARSSQADALSVTPDAGQTLRWSYLFVKVDAAQVVEWLNVVSDVPLAGSGPVSLDAITAAPDAGASSSQAYVATGMIGSLKTRLALHVAPDGAWTIAVDNDKDDRVDFVVQASADEARALMPGR